MTDGSAMLANRAAELRSAFDRSFAKEQRLDGESTEDLLAIRLGQEPYAMRLSEIAGLFADKKITLVPRDDPALLGIAGFRGAIVPVYDLRALLGQPTAIAARMLVLAASLPVAFAFDVSDGHLRIPRNAIAPRGIGDPANRYVREIAHADDELRSIVHLGAVIEAITKRIP